MFKPLTSSDRVMVLAPHPDDESLATGGLLQCAVSARAALRVIFLTDGENNPWPQRFIEWRWRIGPDQTERWRRRRQAESLAALKVLGVAPEDVAFVSMPDQGLTNLLLSHGLKTAGLLVDEIRRWRPTVLVEPARMDLHPDHSAAAVLIELAMKQLGPVPVPRRIAFVVHALGLSQELRGEGAMTLTADQQETKRRAIRCHASQTRLRPKGLLAMAREYENFHEIEAMEKEAVHPVQQVEVEGEWIRMHLSMHCRIGAFGRATMLVLIAKDGLVHGAFEMTLGRQGDVTIRNYATAQTQGIGRYRGNRRWGQVLFPKDLVATGSNLWVKIERRFGFYDEAGWRMPHLK
jgi:LmbE family N-acetylglucosaminyl deacetylase